MDQTYHVYILASGRNGTLYAGVTGDLPQRCWQHHNGEGSEFTRRYKVHPLVHAEAFGDVNEPSPARKRSRNGGANGNWS